MKRDMDLVRDILLRIEKHESPNSWLKDLEFNGFDSPTVHYHLEKLSEAGLINAKRSGAISTYAYMPTSLTWSGHEFLDAIRDPEVWAKTKSGAMAAGGFTFDLIKDLAKGFLKMKIKEHTGVAL